MYFIDHEAKIPSESPSGKGKEQAAPDIKYSFFCSLFLDCEAALVASNNNNVMRVVRELSIAHTHLAVNLFRVQVPDWVNLLPYSNIFSAFSFSFLLKSLTLPRAKKYCVAVAHLDENSQ